mmetsp:Transcript_8766/g.20674  ORF Transcript_8766/g.20674 Transcript_8766/m.20674 type:complete len:237 (-) Transcript_8766:49-759(-)
MRHRTGLVQELQISVRMATRVAGIHEQSAIHERSVDVADHRADVSQCIRLAGFVVSGLEGLDVGLEVIIPPLRVGLVAAVHRSTPRDADVGMRQDELVGLRVQGESVHTPARQGKDQDGGRRVQTVACPDQLLPGLQDRPGQGVGILVLLQREALLDGVLVAVLDLLLDRLPPFEILEQPEDGARADGRVGVAGPVEGVEYAHELALDGAGQQNTRLMLSERLGLLVGLGLLLGCH